MKYYLYKSLKSKAAKFLTTFFQPLTSWRLSEAVYVSIGMNAMQGCVIQVRLLRSMHAQDQQKQALQSQFRKKLPKAVDF